MKKVLIICPSFPPVNAADMHRIRLSLPYFNELGWEPVVVTVDSKFIETYSTDDLLLETIPKETRIIRLQAFSPKWTRKIGLGSLSIRSYWFYQRAGDKLLKKEKFDLVYFSTTAFHLLALGPRWKRKFKTPFIVDLQDPWRRDYYLSKPKNQRPPKFWITYNIDRILEARTLPKADGIISVSKGYCNDLLSRYTTIALTKCEVIPFGGAVKDYNIVSTFVQSSETICFKKDKINIIYMGRGGGDMAFAVKSIFLSIKKGRKKQPSLFENLHIWFIGTSYARTGAGTKTIEPFAKCFGLEGIVTEVPDRLPYFEALWLLKQADVLLVPGSNDCNYTASKIFPYILAARPLLALFHESSSVVDILKNTGVGLIYTFSEKSELEEVSEYVLEGLTNILQKLPFKVELNMKSFEPYSAEKMTRRQVDFFNKVIDIHVCP